MRIMDEMVQPAQSHPPEDPDRPAKRLSPDESLWEGEPGQGPGRGPGSGQGSGSPPPDPPGRRPQWRRALRVNLLLAGAAAVLLLVGFLLGLGAGRGSDGSGRAPAASSPPATVAAAPVTVTSIVLRPGPPPRSCRDAVEWADKAIAYTVGNVRDDRLTRAIRGFLASRRACQRALR